MTTRRTQRSLFWCNCEFICDTKPLLCSCNFQQESCCKHLYCLHGIILKWNVFRLLSWMSQKTNKTFSFGFCSAVPQHAPFISLQALCQQHRRFILSPCPWLRHSSLLSNSAGQMNHKWMRKLNLMPKQGLQYGRLRFISILSVFPLPALRDELSHSSSW